MLSCRESEKTARALCLSGFLLRVINTEDSVGRIRSPNRLGFKVESISQVVYDRTKTSGNKIFKVHS